MAEEEKTTTAQTVTGSDDIEKGKGLAWLSYIGILWLVPLLALKENAFCKFHVKQGIMLTIWFFAIGIIGAIPFIGWFIIRPLGLIFGLILAIMGIINAASGKYWKMPLLGKLAENWFKF
uniref:DUF4870 domain-containing protein n=1 Tax=candidate division WOR-3 bacterium TaxID=2052148 RepID=A0A7V3UZ28_UNCW3